jgi:hypothetical protein
VGEAIEMAFVDWENVVEELATDAANESLGDGIHAGKATFDFEIRR